MLYQYFDSYVLCAHIVISTLNLEILLICNFHPSRARDCATTIISKLNNFAEVLAVRVHVDVYMATAALRSLTHETLCDSGQRTPRNLPPPIHHQIPPL